MSQHLSGRGCFIRGGKIVLHAWVAATVHLQSDGRQSLMPLLSPVDGGDCLAVTFYCLEAIRNQNGRLVQLSCGPSVEGNYPQTKLIGRKIYNI